MDEADILWFIDLPPTRREFERIRRALQPNCRTVLQILESPVLGAFAFLPANQAHFDAVLRYDCPERLPPGHFAYCLPNTLAAYPVSPDFERRKGLLLLNSNRVEGICAIRQPGRSGLPFFGKAMTGWAWTPALLAEYLGNERYSFRRRLARSAERGYQTFFDVQGSGWNGEQISWIPFFPNKPYRCWRGVTQLAKHDLCQQYRFVAAIENYQGDRGYVSEKIFDALFAGAVPVYLGDEKIANSIPREVFIDVREFASPTELLVFLQSMPRGQWKTMQEAGQEFLKSPACARFGDEQFVDAAMSVLRYFADVEQDS